MHMEREILWIQDSQVAGEYSTQGSVSLFLLGE